MTYYDASQTRSTGTDGILRGGSTGILARWRAFRTYRRTLNELGALSDRELADLGLTRGNLRSVAHGAAYGNGAR